MQYPNFDDLTTVAVSARVAAYRIMTGTDSGRDVLNVCDNKLCLNPRHL